MPEETLAQALKQVSDEDETATAFRLDGYLRKDPDTKKLCLYPNPRNRSFYYLIATDDVVGKLYKWTDEERAAAGFAGPESIHRVTVRHGATVHAVAITVLTQAQVQRQQLLQRENTIATSISNVLKTRRDSAKNSIENLR